ncbi:hypothetical protein AB0I35_02235 [Nocardia sp. NPDC050378]|uniref:hypothetical protein n=1 Tax=Nocardia sp. NPDC050378 TaxID=3155400 RepID=UPI0033EAC2D7
MHRRMIRVLVTTAAVAGIAAGATSPALAAPAQPAVIAETGSAGTGSALVDFPLGIMKILVCGIWASSEPHPSPICR